MLSEYNEALHIATEKKICSGLNIDKTISQSLIDKYWTA